MRLVTAVIIFVGSCFGTGYFLGRKFIQKSFVTIGLSSACAAIVWPVLLIAWAVHEGSQYHPTDPGDPSDAPAMLLMSVLFVVVPISFVISLLLILVGIVMARQNTPPSVDEYRVTVM